MEVVSDTKKLQLEETSRNVLILVLMEVVSDKKAGTFKKSTQSLNPCFNGSSF